MKSKILIQEYSEAHESSFLALYSQVFPEKKITAEKIMAIFSREPATVWLALKSSELAGFLYFWTVIDEFQIMDIAVTEKYRRQGVAETLLNKLISEASVKKFAITLDVRVHNTPALKLYEKLGFELVTVRKAYYGNGEDGLVLRIKAGSALKIISTN